MIKLTYIFKITFLFVINIFKINLKDLGDFCKISIYIDLGLEISN